MEPASVFGTIGGQRSQLRQKSPVKRSPSPITSNPRAPHISDEQMREERRGEELRRLIKQREFELSQIAMTKDRLIQKIQTTLNVPEHQTTLHMRHSSAGDPQQSLHKSSSPIKYQQSPLNQTMNSSVLGETLKAPHKDYITQLFHDNMKLQNRIALIESDLERVSIDRQHQSQKLVIIKEQTFSLQQQVKDHTRTEADYQTEINDTRLSSQAYQDRLQELDHTRKGVLFQLNHLQQEKMSLQQQYQELQIGLTHKTHYQQDLDFQLRQSHDVMQQQSKQYLNLQTAIRDQQNQTVDLQHLAEQLKREREDLMYKLHQMDDNYEYTQKELQAEVKHTEVHNKRHQQLIAAKMMFNAMTSSALIKKQEAFSDFFQYCRFDQSCHQALKALARVLENCGRSQMQKCLSQWQARVSQPVKVRKQGYQAAVLYQSTRLKGKFWKIWIQQMSKKDQATEGKDESISLIWRLKNFDQKKENQRVLKIWRDSTKLHLKRQRCLTRLLYRQKNQYLKSALYTWLDYHLECDSAVRIHILTTQFSHEQLMTIALNQLRFRSKVTKMIKLNRLAVLLKGWRDSLCYRKFMMSSMIAEAHMKKQVSQRLLFSCFQAIRLSKETDQFQTLDNELRQNLIPQMVSLTQEIQFKSTVFLQQHKLRCLGTLDTQLRCKLKSYFIHWHHHQQNFQIKVHKNLKEIIQRQYKQQLAGAVSKWQQFRAYQIFHADLTTIDSLQIDATSTQCELESVESHISSQLYQKSKSIRISLAKATRIFNNRLQAHGLYKWQLKAKQLTAMEQQGAGTILKLLRRISLKQVWRQYWNQIHYERRLERQQSKCDHYLWTKDLRAKRIVYNAFLKYYAWYDRARSNLQVLLKNMDIWQQRRSMKQWREQGDSKMIQVKSDVQNQHTLKFDSLNFDLGVEVKRQTQALQINSDYSKKLIDQGKRVLANAFARFYYSKAERGFKKWLEVVKYQHHREDLIKRHIHHQHFQQFYFAKAALQNWIWSCKRQETKDQIAKSIFRADEATQSIEHNRQVYQQTRQQLQSVIDSEYSTTQTTRSKWLKQVDSIIRKQRDCYYMSKCRFILQRWSQFTKRQLKFIRSIEHTVTKSMWQQGFANVSAFARDKALTRAQNRACEGMSRMYHKKACMQAVNIWRLTQYTTTKKQTFQTVVQLQIESSHQYQKVERIKDWNCERGLKTAKQIYLKNLLRAWKTVNRWLKTARVKKTQYRQLETHFNLKIALKKWQTRSKLTYKLRKLTNLFNQHKGHLYLSQCFDGIKQRYLHTKVLCQSIADLGAKYTARNQQSAFQMIRHFVMSRDACAVQEQSVAAQDLGSLLHQLLKRRLCGYYQTLRLKNNWRLNRDKQVKAMMGHFLSKALRAGFTQWCRQVQKQQCCDDVNLQGPVVEEVLKEQMRLEGMKLFIRDQSFTEPQIQQVTKWAKQRQHELLARSVARLKHKAADEDGFILPKMFDRWKMFVKIRQLVRHHLRNIANKLSTKADLSYALNRWKYNQHHTLAATDRDTLCKRCVTNANHKSQLDQLEAQAQTVMSEMALTRDDLVDCLMSSQRIAIAVGRQNQERSLHHAVSTMQHNANQSRLSNFQQILNDRIDMIEQFKDRIIELETDNDSLAVENEELRQFSLDGYAIAKNVKALTQDRESLSVDLADKAGTIRKLLDQNESLQHRIREVQEYTVQLISQSNKAKTRYQSATGRY